MTISKYTNITVSIIVLFVALLLVKYCNRKTYTQQQLDAINLKAENDKKNYIDTLNVVRGQLTLQQEKSNAQTTRVQDLEKYIDSLTNKHNATKNKLIPVTADLLHPTKFPFNVDTTYTLAPLEYINECENCFGALGQYKKENIQLRFERDGYDSLMRQQNEINEQRIASLGLDNASLREQLNKQQMPIKCDTTRKVKLSLTGMFGNPFLPKGGGFGLIYEDKKFNEYSGHVVFTGSGNIYLLNIAKTISFKNKKR